MDNIAKNSNHFINKPWISTTAHKTSHLITQLHLSEKKKRFPDIILSNRKYSYSKCRRSDTHSSRAFQSALYLRSKDSIASRFWYQWGSTAGNFNCWSSNTAHRVTYTRFISSMITRYLAEIKLVKQFHKKTIYLTCSKDKTTQDPLILVCI